MFVTWAIKDDGWHVGRTEVEYYLVITKWDLRAKSYLGLKGTVAQEKFSNWDCGGLD